jgi:hypothetical protein
MLHLIMNLDEYIKSVEMLIEPLQYRHDAIHANFQFPHGGHGYNTCGGDFKEHLKNLHLNECDKKRIKLILSQMDNVLQNILKHIKHDETELSKINCLHPELKKTIQKRIEQLQKNMKRLEKQKKYYMEDEECWIWMNMLE